MRLKKQNKFEGMASLNSRHIISKRLIIRPLVAADYEQWSEVRQTNREWLVVWEPTRNPRKQDPALHKGTYQNRCDMWERESGLGRAYQFGIFLPADSGGNGNGAGNGAEVGNGMVTGAGNGAEVENGIEAGMGTRTGKEATQGEKFIGEINMTAIYRGVAQNCSLGYWIDERYAGKSYMPEAVFAICMFAFDVLELHRVQIAIVPRNEPSLRVVEKLELRREGLSERFLEINGTWEDHYIFAFTYEEYLERQAELFAQWLPDSAGS